MGTWGRHLAGLLTVLVLGLAVSPVAARAQAGASAVSVPPAAALLAARLHVTGTPVIGNLAQGNERPWSVWGAPALSPATKILSAGPLGARGTFDYYFVGRKLWISHPSSRTPLPAARAKSLAVAWLLRLGAGVTQQVTHVLRGWSATIIGGTGLCCWNHSLDIVIFGDYLDTFGTPIVGRGALIYLDGAGRVIQANVVSGRRGPITCHDHMRVDSRGAQVGSLCFDYATAIPWGSLLGGHQPYLEGPGFAAEVAAVQARLYVAPIDVRLRIISTGHGRIVYQAARGRVAYRFTEVEAFPGWRLGPWPLVQTQRVR